MFVLLDKCCEVQLAAEGSGKPLVIIGDMEAKAAWASVGTSASGYCEFFSTWNDGDADKI
jgi:hypothetical protein